MFLGIVTIPQSFQHAYASTVPSAPQNLVVTQDIIINSLDLSWSAPADDGGSTITQYVIQRSSSSSSLSFTTVSTVSGSPPSTSFSDTSLNEGQQYVYQVYAVNSIGNSPTSNIAYGTVSPTPFLNLFGVFGNPLQKDCSISQYSDCYQNSDTITLTFSTPTNQPDVSTKAAVDSLFTFTNNNNPVILGNDYHGTWIAPQILVITIDDVTGTTLPSASGLTVKISSNSGFTNAQGTIQVSTAYPAVILGDFKHTPTPMIYSLVANDPHARNVGYASGDTITMKFTEPTNQPDVSSETAIDKIFYFYDSFEGYRPNLGSHYSGTWITPETLQINITDASGTTTPPLVGKVNVTANSASLGLTVPIRDDKLKSDSSAIMISLPLTGSFVGSFQSNQVVKAGKNVQVGLPSGLSTSIKSSSDGSIKVENTTATAQSQIKIVGGVSDITPSGSTCDPTCQVTFLYSASDFANFGISPTDVKIFHDSNHDSQFDQSEVTQAVVTSHDGIFNITASIPRFSKFAVGGVVVLALAHGGSDTSSQAFSAQSFLGLPSLSQSTKDAILTQNPYEPIMPSNDPSVPYYPLQIGDKNFLIARYANTIQTVTAKTGVPITMNLASSDTTICHVALYTNMEGLSKEIGDSDTYVIYDKDEPLQIVDPHGFFSDVTIKSTTENQVGKIGVSITFAKSMQKSNIFIREWNEARHSSDTKIKDAIEVLESPQSTQTSRDIIPNNLSVQNVSPNPTQEVSTATGNDDITSYIKQWGGYSPDSISDSQLLDHLGIKADHIPSWFMKTTKWIVNGDSSQQEFKDAIKYMSDKGIIK